MGCSTTREKLESRMLVLKLKKIKINQEREERIKDLQRITGKPVIRNEIPDYIDYSNDMNDELNSEKSYENNNNVRQNNFNKNSNSKNSDDIESYSYVSKKDLVNDKRIKKMKNSKNYNNNIEID
jgi:hypothetical protein